VLHRLSNETFVSYMMYCWTKLSFYKWSMTMFILSYFQHLIKIIGCWTFAITISFLNLLIICFLHHEWLTVKRLYFINLHNLYNPHLYENPPMTLVALVFYAYNYNQQSYFMPLCAKNRSDLFYGPFQRLASNHILYVICKRCTNMVVSWLIHYVSPIIR